MSRRFRIVKKTASRHWLPRVGHDDVVRVKHVIDSFTATDNPTWSAAMLLEVIAEATERLEGLRRAVEREGWAWPS